MSAPRVDWDNFSSRNASVHFYPEQCRAECEAQDDCLQYSYDIHGRCRIHSEPKLGMAASDRTSGWLEGRVAKFAREMDECGDEGWLM